MDKIVPIAVRFGVYDQMKPYLSNAIGADGDHADAV